MWLNPAAYAAYLQQHADQLLELACEETSPVKRLMLVETAELYEQQADAASPRRPSTSFDRGSLARWLR